MGLVCPWRDGRALRIHGSTGSGRYLAEEVKGTPHPYPCGGGDAAS
jgi:hypothetical protein